MDNRKICRLQTASAILHNYTDTLEPDCETFSEDYYTNYLLTI